jgi:UDP-N-acetylglucosamine 3-dehydrogenase
VLRALEAGRHALVELPLADNLADAQRVVEADERSDTRLNPRTCLRRPQKCA